MQLKIIFSVVCFISVIVLMIAAGYIKKPTGYRLVIKRLLYAAAGTLLANILIAHARSEMMANLAHCAYYNGLDWICYFLCIFVIEYSENKHIPQWGKRVMLGLCIADTLFLISNLATPYIFHIYTTMDANGEIFFQAKAYGFYYIHLAVDYSLILVAIVLLMICLVRSYGFYRRKYAIIITVIGVIIVLNVLYMLFSLPLDFSVLAYAAAGILLDYYASRFIPKHITNQAFGHVMNYMNEGIILFDKDNQCIFVNAVIEKKLGLTNATATMDCEVLRSINDGRILTDCETFQTTYATGKDQDEHYKVYFHNMLDTKHRSLGIFYIFENVTEEFHAYARMKEAQAAADHANQAKSMFLANMSHEIRTPINSVLGMNEMILRESSDEQILEYAQNIDFAGNALLSLINDILDFSKIEAGKLELVEGNYSFGKLLHECYLMLTPRAEAKNLAFTVKMEETIPATLYGDKNRVLQIMVNIISNAIKYTSSGSVFVKASYEKPADIGEAAIDLVVQVKDTGIGISKENQDKLFSAFVRVDQRKNRNIEGTGLGLAITKQLAGMMQGDIQIESKVGEGSTFTVRLRQRVVDASPIGTFGEKADVAKVNKEASFVAPWARILIVDDVKMNLRVAAALLKRTQVKIDLADSGSQAIELCEKNAYDLILMDHMMPDPDGIETFKQIRQKQGPNQHTPQIILTANAIQGVSEEYLKIGFEDYLAKPVKGEELEAMLAKYLTKTGI